MTLVPGNDPITQVIQAPPRATSAHLEAGAMIGDIQIVRLVTQGASSFVYQAQNLLVGKPCAIKLFRPELGIGAVKRGRLLHAVRRADTIDVEGIASIFGGGLAPDAQTTYIVQEWIEGQSLRDILQKRGALSSRAYLPVLRQIAQILAATHAAGVSHLALHTGNILLTPKDGEPRVTLIDFGFQAVHPAPAEQIPGLQRHPEEAYYLAPEQAKGHAGDHRSDIYALSAILYEMVTGRPPLVGETFATTVEKQISEAPQAPGHLAAIPPELEAAILRGLDKDPGRRIPSVEAFLAAIDPTGTTTGKHQVLHPSPSVAHRALAASDPHREPLAPLASAPAPSPLVGIHDTPPRTKTWIYLIVATVLILLAGGVTAFVLWPKPPPKKTSPRASTTKHSPRRRHPTSIAPKAKRLTPHPHPKATPSPAKPPRVPRHAKTPTPKNTVASKTVKSLLARSMHRIDPRRFHVIQHTGPPGAGSITVITRDSSAKIFLDGNYVGTGKRRTLRRVSSGRHQLYIEVRGEKFPAKTITLPAKGSVEVQLP